MKSAQRSGDSSALRNLPDILEYTGEFGAELVLFMPFCEWLSSQGHLQHRSLRIYAGMKCFYSHMNCRSIIEKDEDRDYVTPAERPAWMPIRDEHHFDIAISNRCLRYPDLRARFAGYTLPGEIAQAEKPLLVIHNKFSLEWHHEKPINYIPVQTLDRLFGELKSTYTIVYIRHGADTPLGYSRDHNTPLELDDAEVLQDHPTVFDFNDLYRRALRRGQADDFNTFKNAIYSRCHHFISSQGGGAHQMAFYSGSLMAILHKQGRELEWAYSSGYYGFMASPPPTRMVCHNEHELELVIPIFAKSRVIGGRAVVRAPSELLEKLSPFRQQPRPSF